MILINYFSVNFFNYMFVRIFLAWAHLLSKSQLRATTRSLRESCGVCLPMPNMHETPSILSACLVSTESDSNFRVFVDSFAYDERFGQGAKQCPLSTPEDVSCTHIMVFPTSALIQVGFLHTYNRCLTSGRELTRKFLIWCVKNLNILTKK